MEAATLSSFPDAYFLSIVAKCLLLLPLPGPTHLCNQLHFLRLLESLHKGMGRREQTWDVSGTFRKSSHFPLCLFTSLLLSSFLEGVSHNFSNFVVVFSGTTYKRRQNPRENNAPRISTTFAFLGHFTEKGWLSFMSYVSLSLKSIDKSHRETIGLLFFPYLDNTTPLAKTSIYSSGHSLMPHVHSQ